ncbi:MAG: hypothetical protein ACM3X3_08910 [Betaproteobacteria bacterium]
MMVRHSSRCDGPGGSAHDTSRACRITLCAFLASVFLWTFVSCFSGAAQAQVSISLTPLLVELTGAPGETKTFNILLVNASKTATTHFRVFTSDVVQKPNGDYRVVK